MTASAAHTAAPPLSLFFAADMIFLETFPSSETLSTLLPIKQNHHLKKNNDLKKAVHYLVNYKSNEWKNYISVPENGYNRINLYKCTDFIKIIFIYFVCRIKV